MDAKPIHIYDRHSPPPRPTTHNLTTHAIPRPLLQDGLMTGLELAHMNQQRQARYHPFGDGHVQAHSVFGPELGTWQQLQPESQQQLSHFSTLNLHHSTTAPPHPTRHTPPGEGHVQTGWALRPSLSIGQYLPHGAATDAATRVDINLATLQWPRQSDGPMNPPLALMYQQQPARNHPLGAGHVQAHSVLGPEPGTGQQQHPYYPTQILHHSLLALLQPARHQPPGEEHGQPGMSSGVRHSLTRTASLHETVKAQRHAWSKILLVGSGPTLWRRARTHSPDLRIGAVE